MSFRESKARTASLPWPNCKKVFDNNTFQAVEDSCVLVMNGKEHTGCVSHSQVLVDDHLIVDLSRRNGNESVNGYFALVHEYTQKGYYYALVFVEQRDNTEREYLCGIIPPQEELQLCK